MNNEPLIEAKLLKILEVVLTERSITRAAKTLGLSQPAVSTALRRARQILGDPLVIAGGKDLVLTERAEQLQEAITRTLTDIDNLVLNRAVFEPASATGSFRIASPDNVAHELISRLFGQIYHKAPQISLELNAFGYDFDPFTALRDGSIDVVIGNWAELPDNLHYTYLYEDRMVCLVRKGHPLEAGISREAYLQADHIAPSQFSVGKRGVVDIYLSRHRLKRRVVAVVPFFNLAPYALMTTDLIFTVNESMARFFAEKLDLVMVEPPLPFPKVKYAQLWHERSHASPALSWLRREILVAAKAMHA
jgi:DNA-binding transcriptional LysR family regulator